MVDRKQNNQPSKLEAYEACPSYMSEPYDPDNLHPNTVIGNNVHKAQETGDVSGLTELELALYDKTTEFLKTFYTEDVVVEVEQKITASEDPLCWGYADRRFIYSDRATVVDTKFGETPVTPAEHNLQGIAYAVSTFKDYPEVKEVEVVFYLPRQEPSVTSHTFYREELHELETRIVRIGKRRGNGERVYNKHCMYCAHLSSCETVKAKVLPVLDRNALPEVCSTDVISMNPDQLSEALAVRSLLRKRTEEWISAVETALKDADEAGFVIPGWKVEECPGRRKVKNPMSVLEAVKEFDPSGNAGEDAVIGSSSMTVSQLEKFAKASFPGRHEQFLTFCWERGVLERGDDWKKIVKEKSK